MTQQEWFNKAKQLHGDISAVVPYLSLAPKFLIHESPEYEDARAASDGWSDNVIFSKPLCSIERAEEINDFDVRKLSGAAEMDLALTLDGPVMRTLLEESRNLGKVNIYDAYDAYAEASAFVMENSFCVPARTVADPYAFFHYIRSREDFDEAAQRDVIQTRLHGHVGTTDVFVSYALPKGTILVFPPPEYTGELEASWLVQTVMRPTVTFPQLVLEVKLSPVKVNLLPPKAICSFTLDLPTYKG